MLKDEKNHIPDENVNSAAKIFEEYGDFIYRTIRYKVQNKASVEDLYQNFFLSLVANPIPKDTNNIKGYLYRAIIRDVIDSDRQTKKYQNVIEKYFKNLKFLINDDDSRNAFNSRKAFEETLRKNWERLSPNETKAMILRYKESCGMEDIAKKMNVKKETAIKYICVGLKKIRNC